MHLGLITTRLSHLLAAFAITVALLPSVLWAGANKTIIASGAIGWNPYLMRSPDTREYSGVLHDALLIAAQRIGATVKFVDFPWKRAVENMEHGDVDVICGMYWTKERAQKYNYSAPVLQDDIVVFATRRFEIDSLEDLVGKRGDRPLGGSYGDKFDSFARKHLAITQIPGKELSFQRLLRGHTDYCVLAQADGMYYLKQQGLTDKVHVLPYVISTNDVHYVFSKNTKKAHLLTMLFAELDRLREDGTIRKLLKSYIHH